MLRRFRVETRRTVSGRRGFTLIEVVVALGIISVAAYIAISLYSSSIAFTRDARFMTVASELAEERLTDVEIHPEAYSWPDEWPAGEPVAIGPVGAEDPDMFFPCERPAALPTDRRAGMRESSYYDQFEWRVFARSPGEDAGYIEATAVIQWTFGTDKSTLTRTTFIPRSAVGGGA